MKSQTISGTPKRCPNRHCRVEFTKQSHQGYLPNDCYTVWVVMRCDACNDTFMVCQSKSDAWEYHQALPHDPEAAKTSRKPISKSDVRAVKKSLQRGNPLKDLYERRQGIPPGELRDES